MIVECFRFITRNHQQGESVATYIAELRHLTRYCDFDTSLNDMLHDRLMCGIENGRIQRRLLAEPALTLDKVEGISLVKKSANHNAKDLQKESLMVNAVQHKVPSRAPPLTKGTLPSTQTGECYRCGGPHLAPDF